jgi:hypothetical protein
MGLAKLEAVGEESKPCIHYNASNSPPIAIIGAMKAGAVIAGCASPELMLVALPTLVATPAVTV